VSVSREDCVALDAADPLGAMRERFALPEGVIYLDGNSLGALPAHTAAHVGRVIEAQWGRDLIGSWNTHGWIDAPLRVGAAIAPLIGAGSDEVLVADTVSINLFKLLAGGLSLRPGRRVIVSERENFPTDLYIMQGLRDLLGDVVLRVVPHGEILGALDDSVAVLLLNHVDYKSGRRWDMAQMTEAGHAHGALVLWDLCHSAGAVSVDLGLCNADLAVGCGYKFLNGGPGAPGFLFVAGRHQAEIVSPLSGWLGHEAPFAFDTAFAPARGIRRMLCSSPSILAIAALEAAVELWAGVDLAQVEAKAGRLGDLFIALVEALCEGQGLLLSSPRAARERGAQVSFAHRHGYAVMQALIARGVVGDFREPDLIRFGFAPLTTRYVDVFDAASALAAILREGVHRDPRFGVRAAVT
jgi:kynureninase